MLSETIEHPLLRARGEDEKNERRRAILRAADRLINIRSRKLPAAADIAREAGLAKGTLYLYFKTREEIYLDLLGEWFALCANVLDGGSRTTSPNVEAMLRRYTRFCAKNPKFVYLASMSATILEENISVDRAHAFKKELGELIGPRMAVYAQNDDEVLHYQRLFIHLFSLTTGLWQHCHPPDSVVQAYARGDVAFVEMDFETELYQALRGLFRGAQETRRDET